MRIVDRPGEDLFGCRAKILQGALCRRIDVDVGEQRSQKRQISRVAQPAQAVNGSLAPIRIIASRQSEQRLTVSPVDERLRVIPRGPNVVDTVHVRPP